MGFFYQALKKATGVETDVPEETLQTELMREPATRTVSESPRPRVKRRFDLKHPVESLVAFISGPVEDQNMIAMEHCRVLRARIWETMRNKNLKTLLMTSAMPGDGKTLLSVNLAFALSQIENARILLVGVDLRRPSLSSFLGMTPDKGLNTYLEKGDSFEDVCWSLNDSLDVVPTLPVEEYSAELLHGKQMVRFLEEAKTRYDIILMDGPPLFPIVDAQVLAPLVDAAILVVRSGKTPCEESRQAAEMIKPKFIGTILNGVKDAHKAGYYGGYYQYGSKAKKKK